MPNSSTDQRPVPGDRIVWHDPIPGEPDIHGSVVATMGGESHTEHDPDLEILTDVGEVIFAFNDEVEREAT